jgi:hypothetical protein
MRGSLLEFSECGSRIAESKNLARFQIRKSEINNPRCLKTPRRGQSAESPDRFIVKKAADFSSIYFRNNASASILS